MQIEILEYADKAGILLPVLIFIVVIVYVPKVIQLIDSWKMRKINYLSTLNSNELLSEDIKKMLVDEINNVAFKSIHGIRVETLLREQLSALHNSDRDRFPWKRLRMAVPYIESGDNGIVVKIAWYDRLASAASIVGLIMTSMAYGFFWIYFIYHMTITYLIITLIASIVSGLLFFMFAYELAQHHHANKLIATLEEQSRN